MAFTRSWSQWFAMLGSIEIPVLKGRFFVLRRWKTPMHTLRTGLDALGHSGFCYAFFESVWQENMKPFVEKQGQWVVTRFDLLFNFSTQIHWFTWQSLKNITPLATRNQASPKSDPLGWGASNLVMGLGWFHKAFDIKIAQTKVGAIYTGNCTGWHWRSHLSQWSNG